MGELAAPQTASEASVHVLEFNIRPTGATGAMHSIAEGKVEALDPQARVAVDGELLVEKPGMHE